MGTLWALMGAFLAQIWLRKAPRWSQLVHHELLRTIILLQVAKTKYSKNHCIFPLKLTSGGMWGASMDLLAPHLPAKYGTLYYMLA